MKQLNLPFIFMLSVFILFSACDDSKGDVTPTTTEETIEPTTKSDKTSGITDDYTGTPGIREVWQKPELVLQFLGGLKGKTVADIGAGRGFFTFELVKANAEKVIAIDVDPYFIHFLDSTKIHILTPALQANLETRLTTPDKPGLAKEEVDIIVIVNTFMYIENHEDYLIKLKDGIKEGGKLLIIDFKKKRTNVGPPAELREPLFQVEDELYEAGYKNIVTNDCALDYQYIVIAEK